MPDEDVTMEIWNSNHKTGPSNGFDMIGNITDDHNEIGRKI